MATAHAAGSLMRYGSYSSNQVSRPDGSGAANQIAAQWPPSGQQTTWQVHAPRQNNVGPGQSQAHAGLSEDYANKVAEITVLRNRLQQFERENIRLQNEIASTKDVGPQTEKARQRQAQIELLQSELHFARQNLLTSEEDRKRLKLTLESAQNELSVLQSTNIQQAAPKPQQAAPNPKPLQAAAVGHRDEMIPWQREVMLRELACWAATASEVGSSTWFQIQEAVCQLRPTRTTSDVLEVGLAKDVSIVLQRLMIAEKWTAIQMASRFVKTWFSLCPSQVATLAASLELSSNCDNQPSIFSTLSNCLHCAVLDLGPNETGETTDTKARQTCAMSVMEALLEATRQLRKPDSLSALVDVLQRPSLCAILNSPEGSGPLQVLCLALLQALMSSPELFALAHQADSGENPLLATANLLLVPCIGLESDDSRTSSTLARNGYGSDADKDTPERQQCRILALEVFCRCLATAPRLDFVLQLRATASTDADIQIDTVLQRVVLLCHHELLCLRLYVDSSFSDIDNALKVSFARRTRSVELCLLILSSFIWHSVPRSLDARAESSCKGHSDDRNQFGRTRLLVGSIIDMVDKSNHHAIRCLQSSAAALKPLLETIDQ